MPALLVERFTEPFDHFLALAGLLGGIQRFVSACVRHKNLRAALVRHRTGRKSPEQGSRVRALYAHFKKFRWIGGSKNSSIAS